MRLPDSHTHRLIDCLTRSQLSFALYRLPWTDECYFILQTSEKVEMLKDIAELNGKKGFVIAPFQQTDEHPLVLIRPDVTAYDWDEISQTVASMEYADAILTCKSQPAPRISHTGQARIACLLSSKPLCGLFLRLLRQQGHLCHILYNLPHILN